MVVGFEGESSKYEKRLNVFILVLLDRDVIIFEIYLVSEVIFIYLRFIIGLFSWGLCYLV